MIATILSRKSSITQTKFRTNEMMSKEKTKLTDYTENKARCIKTRRKAIT